MNKLTEIPLMLFLLSFAILISLSCVSAASTVYVNATGSDSNLGTIDSPYLTIGKGINNVDENGTVQIADGKYSGENNTNITISKNMIITGQHQKKTIINGTGTNWIFTVSKGVNVIIQNLTITNATTTGNGGAIYNPGNLNVSNCTFTGNKATYGGAIYNTGTIGSLSGCTFTGNIAISNDLGGGAIYNNRGTITSLSGCTFTHNNATWAGGAILNYEGTITSLSDSTFINNTATSVGGAIANAGSITVNGCNFIGNTVTGIIWGGGAIYNQVYDISVHFSRFVNNTATNGKDIYCLNSGSGSVDAKYNWWGSNSDPSSRIYGNVDVSPWLVLSISANPTEIFNTKTSKVTVNLYKDSDNGDHSSEYAKYPSEIPLTFTTTWGSITQTVLTYGTGTAIFTANGGSVPQQNPVTISAADIFNQTATVSTNIIIKPVANLYINTTSSSKNPKIGDIFKITYKLGNKGPDDAKNVTITFQMPKGLEYVNIGVDSGKCSYDKATRTVTWTLDSVPVGDPYLYLTVLAAGDGTYKITPNVTSETYNLNFGDFGIITFDVQPNSNNNSNDDENVVNAASKTTKTIGLQETGIPINYIILAVLMVLSGLIVPKRK